MTGKVEVFGAYFDRLSNPLSPEQLKQLGEMQELTLGDVAVVSDQMRWHPRAELTNEKVLGALEAEIRYRRRRNGRKVGFTR